MSEHTPGPWHLKTSRNSPEHFEPMEDGKQFDWQLLAANPGENADDYGWAVASGSSWAGEIVPSEHDLALLAAAPDLREACTSIVRLYDALVATTGDPQLPGYQRCIVATRAAIAKTEPPTGE